MTRVKAYYSEGTNRISTAARWVDPVTGEVYLTPVGGAQCVAQHLPTGVPGEYRTASGKSTLQAEQVPAAPAFDASTTGRKIGKVRMDLVMQDMPRAIEALARVMTWALESKGYKESDWLHVPDGERVYSGGLHRHDNKEKRGQEFDDESGLEHAIHTAWNAMARVELILRRKEQA